MLFLSFFQNFWTFQSFHPSGGQRAFVTPFYSKKFLRLGLPEAGGRCGPGLRLAQISIWIQEHLAAARISRINSNLPKQSRRPGVSRLDVYLFTRPGAGGPLRLALALADPTQAAWIVFGGYF